MVHFEEYRNRQAFFCSDLAAWDFPRFAGADDLHVSWTVHAEFSHWTTEALCLIIHQGILPRGKRWLDPLLRM
jgi:hypothetical protein